MNAYKGMDDIYTSTKERPQTSFAASIAVDMSGSMNPTIRKKELYDAVMTLGDCFAGKGDEQKALECYLTTTVLYYQDEQSARVAQAKADELKKADPWFRLVIAGRSVRRFLSGVTYCRDL